MLTKPKPRQIDFFYVVGLAVLFGVMAGRPQIVASASERQAQIIRTYVRNQRVLWAAVIPSITAMGGRVTVFFTPFLPGSLFWEIATNHKNKHDHWSRNTITIEDAISQGMPLPGGLDELRMLFDSETWAMFCECQRVENGSALLSWELLYALTTEVIDPA